MVGPSSNPDKPRSMQLVAASDYGLAPERRLCCHTLISPPPQLLASLLLGVHVEQLALHKLHDLHCLKIGRVHLRIVTFSLLDYLKAFLPLCSCITYVIAHIYLRKLFWAYVGCGLFRGAACFLLPFILPLFLMPLSFSQTKRGSAR